MNYDFLIGGVRIRIVSAVPLSVGERWRLFSASILQPDHTYYICFTDGLIMPAEEIVFRGEFVSCAFKDGKSCRWYRNARGETYAEISELSDNYWELRLRRELLPWGSEIDHLFPLLGFSRVLLHHDKLLIHGAYILCEYGGILFTAPSGTGKTTQAELWRSHRSARIINGDRAILSLNGDHAMIHSFTHSGSSPDCKNLDSSLFAVVSLSQGQKNTITDLRGMDAIRSLIQGSYLLPEFRQDLPQLLTLAERFSHSVPLLHLSCLPDVTSVETLDRMLNNILHVTK